MRMINRIVLVGRLTRDPELRRTTTDVPVATFTLASDDRRSSADGQRTTTFIDVTVWRNQAENVAKYCRKGSLVGVDGRIRQRNFERRDGTKASVIEIVADSVIFLEPKGETDITQDSGYVADVDLDNIKEDSKNLESIDVTDDDLPF